MPSFLLYIIIQSKFLLSSSKQSHFSFMQRFQRLIPLIFLAQNRNGAVSFAVSIWKQKEVARCKVWPVRAGAGQLPCYFSTLPDCQKSICCATFRHVCASYLPRPFLSDLELVKSLNFWLAPRMIYLNANRVKSERRLLTVSGSAVHFTIQKKFRIVEYKVLSIM